LNRNVRDRITYSSTSQPPPAGEKENCPPLEGVRGRTEKNNDMQTNSNYNKTLQPFARELRQNMTKAECCLWKYVLKARKMRGYIFRRQRPVLSYIADFMCFDLKLVIEVDGYTHHLDETYIKDQKKDKDLRDAGYHILRFTDEEILSGIWNVARCIEQYVEDYELIHPPAPASGGDAKLSPSGEPVPSLSREG
jgi:very-short-patch-repair endonuclease